jgi:hypothetical protein
MKVNVSYADSFFSRLPVKIRTTILLSKCAEITVKEYVVYK